MNEKSELTEEKLSANKSAGNSNGGVIAALALAGMLAIMMEGEDEQKYPAEAE